MKKIAYVRVSTVEQNEARQIEALQKYGIDKWFTEKVSGKNMDRPELQKMLGYIRGGDVVYISDFSRLARSTTDLLYLTDYFKKNKVQLVSDKERFDTNTPIGKCVLTVIGAINEFERENLLERQREGIEIAKANGKYKGRKKIQIKNFREHYERYMKREVTKSQLAKELGISRPTLDKLIHEQEQSQNK